jgi:glycosyl transferase family 87
MATSEAVSAANLSTPVYGVSTGVDRQALRYACVLIAVLLVPLLLWVMRRSSEVHYRDFVYFYSIGTLLNEYPADRLYNYGLQRQIDNKVLPMESGGGIYGASPYPPYLALLFEPFAKLPFMMAYHVWMVVTLCLYSAGLFILVRTFLRDSLNRTAWFLAALLPWTFLGHTLSNGQISAIGFFAMSSAISAQYRNRPYLSGLALSMCLYKPPLLIWIVPLLLVSRAKKTVLGFLSGAFVLVVATTAALGVRIWPGYAAITLGMLDSHRYFPHAHEHYLDILGQFALATDSPSRLGSTICLLLGALGIVFIWRYVLGLSSRMGLIWAWAITLPAGLLVNVYSPIYDSLLLIPGLIATQESFRRVPKPLLISGALSLVLASYFTTWIAVVSHVQVLSLLILSVIIVQLWGIRRARAAMNN